MLFSIVAIGLTSQAQSVENVQNETEMVRSHTLPTATIDEIVANFVKYEIKTKLVAFTYEATPSLNKIIVTTTDSLYAKVLAVTYDLKSHTVNDNGKHTFEFGNRVREARIYTNLVSANGDNFHVHRVKHTS
jgi:hypothetical protein